MVYGIDLGTTNTIIGYGNTLYTDLVKSSVNLDTMKQEDDLTVPGVVHGYKIKMSIQDCESANLARKASSVVLKKVVGIANSITGANVKDLVISVPAAFTQLQRKGTIESAKMNGFNVLRIIDEPTAACISAGAIKKGVYLVIDVGGGTSDVSIVDNTTGKYMVKSTYGTFLGGDDLDNYIIDNYFIGNICPVIESTKPTTRAKLKELAIKFKCDITKDSSMFFGAEGFGGIHSIELDYSDLEHAISEVFKPVIRCIKSCIADSRCNDVQALFVGGTCRNEAVCDFFRKAINVKYSEITVDKYMAVAKGVAMFAEMVDKGTEVDMVVPISKRIMARPHGNKNNDSDEFVVIEPNQAIPLSASFEFIVNEPTRTASFDIFTGNEKSLSDCNYEGSVSFKLFDDREEPEVGVLVFIQFTIDSDNIFSIKSVNLDSNFTDTGNLSFV